MPNIASGSIKKLNVIMTTEKVVKDPLSCKGYQQFQIINLFLDSLVRKDPSYGIVSGVAASWEVSSDQLTYTFNISKDSFFHNGDPILSKDVLFSINRHLEKGSESVIAGYIKNAVQSVTSADDRTVKFLLKGSYPPFLELLSMPGLGIISHKSTSANIIGSGPYKFMQENGKFTCMEKYKKYKFKTTNIDEFCFEIERDVEKTIKQLNSNEIGLAMGSPLEVALSEKLKDDFVGSPTFSLVTTHIFLNHSNPFFQIKENRVLIKNIALKVRNQKGILTKFDSVLDTFLPKGIMPESYYENIPVHEKSISKISNINLRIVFPYGIFLEKTVLSIVESFKSAGFNVTYKNVKGKDLLNPILAGDFDLLFVPYQGVIADADGYLDMLDPESMFSKAKLPTKVLLSELSKVRFLHSKIERLTKYEKIFKSFEDNVHIIPFSQNSIPLVYNKNLKLPNLNFAQHLNLRELNFLENEK